MHRVAALTLLFLADCSSRGAPGPSCTKLLEVVRASCERADLERSRRQKCDLIEEAVAAQRSQVEWDEEEDVCEAQNRALEAPLLETDTETRRWGSAMTYKFVGALGVFMDKPVLIDKPEAGRDD